MVTKMIPELSFKDMLWPVVITEANGIPVKPRKPNNGPTEERPVLPALWDAGHHVDVALSVARVEAVSDTSFIPR
jgi:hypothetical protein